MSLTETREADVAHHFSVATRLYTHDASQDYCKHSANSHGNSSLSIIAASVAQPQRTVGKKKETVKTRCSCSTLLALASQTQAQNGQEPSQSMSVCMTYLYAIARTLQVRERSTKVCSAPLHSKENTLAKFPIPQSLHLSLVKLKPCQLLHCLEVPDVSLGHAAKRLMTFG